MEGKPGSQVKDETSSNSSSFQLNSSSDFDGSPEIGTNPILHVETSRAGIPTAEKTVTQSAPYSFMYTLHSAVGMKFDMHNYYQMEVENITTFGHLVSPTPEYPFINVDEMNKYFYSLSFSDNQLL
jgi:hypothetical protein